MKSFDFETNYYVNFKSNGDLLVNFIGNSTISQGSDKDSDPIYIVANKIDSVVYANARATYSFNENLNVYLADRIVTNKTPQTLPVFIKELACIMVLDVHILWE